MYLMYLCFELKILETKTPDLEAQRFREEYYRDKNTHESWKDKMENENKENDIFLFYEN